MSYRPVGREREEEETQNPKPQEIRNHTDKGTKNSVTDLNFEIDSAQMVDCRCEAGGWGTFG